MLRYVCGLQLLIATKKLVDNIAGLGAAILNAALGLYVSRAITSLRHFDEAQYRDLWYLLMLLAPISSCWASVGGLSGARF